MRLSIFAFLASLFLFSTGAQAAVISTQTADYGDYSYTISDPYAAPTGTSSLKELAKGNSSGNVVSLWMNYLSEVTNGKHHQYVPWGLSKKDPFLVMYGNNSTWNNGVSVFTLAEGMTSFSFTWGSINTNNIVGITTGSGDYYEITGSELLSLAHLESGYESRYFTLTDLRGIVSVMLRGICCDFQVANVTATPIPGALLLFGTALVGARAMRRRKQVA